MVEYSVKIPWPHSDLFANKGKYWPVKARRTKESRGHAAYLAKAFGVSKLTDVPKSVKVRYILNPPIKRGRRPDKQNCAHALKAAQDGIADALGVDDSIFDDSYEWGERAKLGSVVVEIKVV